MLVGEEEKMELQGILMKQGQTVHRSEVIEKNRTPNKYK